MTLVVDAGPLIAFTDLADPRYEATCAVLREEPGPLVVPAPVTAEADYMIGRRVGEPARRAFVDDLAARRFEVECLSIVDYGRISALQRQYDDQRLGLADLSIVVVAARLGTTRILTFDERHFRAIRPLDGTEAFTLLPADA